jgi:hypothetical protein
MAVRSADWLEVEVRVRGGFPLIVRFLACPAEPDVGITRSYVDEVEYLTPRGRSADFLRGKLSAADEQLIEDEMAKEMSREPEWD